MKTNNAKHGSALLTTMGVIAIISACLGTIAYTSIQRGHMAVMLGDRIRAQSLAEAGVNHAYSIIATNWAIRTNATLFPLDVSNYGSGTYRAYVQVPSATSTVISIVCTGTCRSATAVVALDLMNSGSSSLGWDAHAFDFAVLCGGTFDFGGCGNIVSTNATATLHANGAITVSGSANVGGDVTKLNLESSTSILVKNNNVVKGDVKAPSLDIRGTVVGSETTGAVPPVSIPQINLDPYYQWALAHGEVKPAGWAPSGPYTPNGGIIWVEGATGTINKGPINGAIIAVGGVKLSGAVTITAAADSCGFAVVSRDGDIDNQSSGVISGIVYAKTGSFKQTANGTLIGSLIVAGSVSKGGVSDVVLYQNKVPTNPGDTTGGDIIDIAAWKQ